MEEDELSQIRRVAEAARTYREHQWSIRSVLGAGDVVRQRFDDRTVVLCHEMDVEIRKWRNMGKEAREV